MIFTHQAIVMIFIDDQFEALGTIYIIICRQ